jgi:hypothetical protein
MRGPYDERVPGIFILLDSPQMSSHTAHIRKKPSSHIHSVVPYYDMFYHLKAVVQVLMCSMAVCDAGMLAIGWLLFAVAALDPNWPFGSLLCKLLTYVQGVTGDSSAWTIAIVGIDRYITCSLQCMSHRLNYIIV